MINCTAFGSLRPGFKLLLVVDQSVGKAAYTRDHDALAREINEQLFAVDSREIQRGPKLLTDNRTS